MANHTLTFNPDHQKNGLPRMSIHFGLLFNSVKTNRLGRCIVFVALPALLVYCISLVGLNLSGLSVKQILRDPAQQSGASSFVGFLSNLGVWLWVSAAAVGFFSAFVLIVDDKKPLRELTILLAVFSLTLAVDDFFLIHDRYIPQKYCYLFYGTYALTLLCRHYKTILKIDVSEFLMAGSFLALSILVDLVQKYSPWGYWTAQVFEEGFKFTGAAIWLYFCSSTAYMALTLQIESSE